MRGNATPRCIFNKDANCRSRISCITKRDPITSAYKYVNEIRYVSSKVPGWRPRKFDLALTPQSKWRYLLHAPNQVGLLDENHRLLDSLSQFTLFLGRFFICVLCRPIDSRSGKLLVARNTRLKRKLPGLKYFSLCAIART